MRYAVVVEAWRFAILGPSVVFGPHLGSPASSIAGDDSGACGPQEAIPIAPVLPRPLSCDQSVAPAESVPASRLPATPGSRKPSGHPSRRTEKELPREPAPQDQSSRLPLLRDEDAKRTAVERWEPDPQRGRSGNRAAPPARVPPLLSRRNPQRIASVQAKPMLHQPSAGARSGRNRLRRSPVPLPRPGPLNVVLNILQSQGLPFQRRAIPRQFRPPIPPVLPALQAE